MQLQIAKNGVHTPSDVNFAVQSDKKVISATKIDCFCNFEHKKVSEQQKSLRK